MGKLNIVIASSGRTLILAEKLKEQLHTEFCNATVWSEEGRSGPGSMTTEMLETSAEAYDFAVIVLARDDVVVRGASDALKARDNCLFVAGLFVSALGRHRCFLVTSVEPSDLPADFGGIVSVQLEEHEDLSDRESCARAAEGVGEVLKERVRRAGTRSAQKHVPMLSVDEVFLRERMISDGGDLTEGQVVVCDLQPHPGGDLALQVYSNIMSGVNYLYFLYYSEDTVNKLVQGLQVLVAGSPDADGKAVDFSTRFERIIREKERILEDLRGICRTKSLIVCFLPDEPHFRFRVHNATDPQLARLYLRHPAYGYLLWAQSAGAVSMWESLPRYVSLEDQEQIFVPLKHLTLSDGQEERFLQAIDRALQRYFPGVEDAVRELCIGSGADE